ncbi:MAG: Maf family protein [Candidatus Puniceispirillaceae bacterium]
MTDAATTPFLELPNSTIILASKSITRQNVLRAAGINFVVVPTVIDEVGVRAGARADDMAPDDIAVFLALLKAQAASKITAHTMSPTKSLYIIGCDQILLFDGQIMAKPESMSAAKHQLLALAGKQHELLSAIVVVNEGQRIWHYVARASLTMHQFDEAFAHAYIRHIGQAALRSPGAYQIESVGSSLFARIDGDHFDILGLPLLPLLAILREHGIRPVESI